MDDFNDFGGGDFDRPAPIAPGRGTVVVGKRTYAVGLHWSSVTEPSRAVAEAKTMAAEEGLGADFYCVRQSGTPQFALGFRSMGHAAKMPSLAAHIGASRTGSWIAVFEIDGGYYVAAVRDEAVLAECDQFVDDLGHAHEILETHLGQSSWDDIIAPASFGTAKARPILIEDVLQGKPPIVLAEVRGQNRTRQILLAALLGVAALWAVNDWRTRSHEADLLAKAEQAAAEAAAAVGFTEPPVTILPFPWEGRPNAVAYLENCVEGALSAREDIPGWALTQIECSDGSIQWTLAALETLEGRGTPVTWIAPMIPAEAMVSYAPTGTSAQALVTLELEKAPRIPIDITTLGIEKVRRSMHEIMESRRVPIAFSTTDSHEYTTGINFSFATDEDPRAFSDLLAAIPGVIITNATFVADGGEWTIDGEIHEQLPLPENAVRG